MSDIVVIGGGLAGVEAAWQAARRGVDVILYEMRPLRMTGAHRTGLLAELVCSNSLRSGDISSGPGLLKEELRRAGSLIMEAADTHRVSAGSAIAVDRDRFARYVTDAIETNHRITVVRDELRDLPAEGVVIVATGPLTSEPLSDAIARLVGSGNLYFYDAIAPIIDAAGIDFSKAYRLSRYGKGGDDYVNCPMNRDEYDFFYRRLIEAEALTPRPFEDMRIFEGCMPIEVMARRGYDTMRFGPLKPVGLPDPRTGKTPYAVVQLRPENAEATAYNVVGFQTRLRHGDQKEVLAMIPGLEGVEILRYGSMHRNTFINSPAYLDGDLSCKTRNTVYFAGQITGVEGYIESTAMGLVAGINASRRIAGLPLVPVPRETAHGSLISYITNERGGSFQPSNINFGIMPLGEEALRIKDKRARRQHLTQRALAAWDAYLRVVWGDTVRARKCNGVARAGESF